MSDAAARIRALRDQIAHHDHRYHVMDDPEIADDAYDALFHELRALEAEHPEWVTPDSPTQRVGGAPGAALESAPHLGQMLSLDSSADVDAFRLFDARLRKALGGEAPVRYSLEPKLDGLSVELVYEAGVLVRAVTRGDGQQGEVVTANVRTIRTVPLRLSASTRSVPPLLAVRGEIFLPLGAFDDVNERLLAEGRSPFANPRNAAAGTVRQLDPTLAAERPLALYAYDVLEGDDPAPDTAAGPVEVATHAELLGALAAWGLPVNPENASAQSADEVLQRFEVVAARRDDLPYEIDGLVVKLDDLEARRRLGATAHHPRWAYAIKFPPRKEVSQVLRIVVSVGRTGTVTPVALLRPVSIGGVTVSRANLHNREDIERKDIREGDTVRVERAGDVIPQVVARIDDGGARGEVFRMPEACPSCGTGLVPVGPYTVCPNAFECPAQLVGRLVHFGSRRGLDIEGLGERTARQLVERAMVSHLPDLFALTPADLETLEGFAEVSARKLQGAILAARQTTLPRLLYALGIPEVGAAVARSLAQRFGTLAALRGADVDTLRAVEGIGPVMAESIHRFLHEERNAAVLDDLAAQVETAPIVVSAPEALPLAGQRIVFTGALTRFTREEAETLVERLGGKAARSVSSKTTLVVAGAEAGSKEAKARALAVRIVDEEGFLASLADAGIDTAELERAPSR